MEKHGKDNKINYEDIKVVPLNSEKFITFQIGNLRFLDSYQFLSTSLEELVSLLLKSGKENFVETVKYLGDHDLVFAKGVYPYAYMTDRSKFDETRLPLGRFDVTCRVERLKPLSKVDASITRVDVDVVRSTEVMQKFDVLVTAQYRLYVLIGVVDSLTK